MMKVPWLPDFKVDWPNHTIGFFSALFGILIAFELDEWRERKKEAELAFNAWQKMKQEIEINQNALHEMVRINQSHLSTLNGYVVPYLGKDLQFLGSQSMADSINKTSNGILIIEEVKSESRSRYLPHIVLGNLIHPVLHFSAWESAKATGALNYISYERVQLLSSLYNSTRVNDELAEIKLLLRKAGYIQTKKELLNLMAELQEAYSVIEVELKQYDMFANMLEHI
jgi:hypothetical protein